MKCYVIKFVRNFEEEQNPGFRDTGGASKNIVYKHIFHHELYGRGTKLHHLLL
jgi:hypothetical protein